MSDYLLVHLGFNTDVFSFLFLFVALYCCISEWIVSVVGCLLIKYIKTSLGTTLLIIYHQ